MNIICSICNFHIIETDDLRVSKCGHVHHHDCLSKVLSITPKCPQCNAKCPPKSLIKLELNVDEEENGKEFRVQRLVRQLEAELKVKLSISLLSENAPEVVPVSSLPTGTDVQKMPAPKHATGDVSKFNTIETADLILLVEKNCQVALMQMMSQLQLPSSMQIAVDCMRQASIQLARQLPSPLQMPALIGTPLTLPNGRTCHHNSVGKMWCLDHRYCKDDCRSPMVGLWLLNFHQDGKNGCDYCMDCAKLQCVVCKTTLFDTCVKFKREVYHEQCFPCQNCMTTLNLRAANLLRPSQRYHDQCLICAWCYRLVSGTSYIFRNELPVCESCNQHNIKNGLH